MEALLSFKNGGLQAKRELDFGDDSDHGGQTMTLGPEMFGLKRISDVNTSTSASKGNGSTTSNPVALNRRGIVSIFSLNSPFLYVCVKKLMLQIVCVSLPGSERKIHCFTMTRRLSISPSTSRLENPRNLTLQEMCLYRISLALMLHNLKLRKKVFNFAFWVNNWHVEFSS